MTAFDLNNAKSAAMLPAVRLTCAASVELKPTAYVWGRFIPAGMLVLLGGAGGAGKTTIALGITAVATRAGALWPDGTRNEVAGDVVIWSGEDPHSVLAARLRASGADMSRVHFVDGLAGDESEAFDPARDMLLLEHTIESLPNVRMIILDPIVSAVSGDSHKGAEVRRSLQPVVDLAQRVGCAVIGITHLSKGTVGRDPVERITGSLAFAALARVVLIAAKSRDDERFDRVMMIAKSNVGPDDGGMAYSLDRVELAPGIEGQCVVWGESIEGSAREILGDAESDPEADSGAADIEGFLRAILTHPMPVKAVKAEASDAGYSWDAIGRVSRKLKVEKRKEGMKGGWVWCLPAPDSATRSQPAPKNAEECEECEGCEECSPTKSHSSASDTDVEVF